MSLLARTAEWIIVVSLVLGLDTRYGALLGLAFVIIATVTAHRYWGYPQAAQLVRYVFGTKNLAAAGGFILLFVTGAGRFSIDNKLSSKQSASREAGQLSKQNTLFAYIVRVGRGMRLLLLAAPA
jgi:uncharacterized membrane protein YphA (DoxX/SURF4 family)